MSPLLNSIQLTYYFIRHYNAVTWASWRFQSCVSCVQPTNSMCLIYNRASLLGKSLTIKAWDNQIVTYDNFPLVKCMRVLIRNRKRNWLFAFCRKVLTVKPLVQRAPNAKNLLLYVPNPLKPGVQSGVKMQLEQRREASYLYGLFMVCMREKNIILS